MRQSIHESHIKEEFYFCNLARSVLGLQKDSRPQVRKRLFSTPAECRPTETALADLRTHASVLLVAVTNDDVEPYLVARVWLMGMTAQGILASIV